MIGLLYKVCDVYYILAYFMISQFSFSYSFYSYVAHFKLLCVLFAEACSAFKTGMRCIDTYSKTCLKSQERKILEDHVAGARYTFRFLCDDPGFQSGTRIVVVVVVVVVLVLVLVLVIELLVVAVVVVVVVVVVLVALVVVVVVVVLVLVLVLVLLPVHVVAVVVVVIILAVLLQKF